MLTFLILIYISQATFLFWDQPILRYFYIKCLNGISIINYTCHITLHEICRDLSDAEGRCRDP